MSTFQEQKAENFAAYDRLKETIQTEYRSRYVAIADGRLVAVTDDFNAALASVVHYEHHLVFSGGSEPDPVPAVLRRMEARH